MYNNKDGIFISSKAFLVSHIHNLLWNGFTYNKIYLKQEYLFFKSDDLTTIDKCRVAANITEFHIISKSILQRIILTNFCGPVSHLRESTITDLESPLNFQVKEFFFIQIGPETTKLDCCGQDSHLEKGT